MSVTWKGCDFDKTDVSGVYFVSDRLLFMIVMISDVWLEMHVGGMK